MDDRKKPQPYFKPESDRRRDSDPSPYFKDGDGDAKKVDRPRDWPPPRN